MEDGVADHRAAGGMISPPVDDDAGPHPAQGSVRVRFVPVPQPGRMAVNVPGETFRTAVNHFHRPPGAQGQQAQVYLQAHVLPGSEGPSHPGVMHPHHVVRHPQAGRDLAVVGVGPLGGDMQVHPAPVVGDRQAGFGAQRGLILHPHLVIAFHRHPPLVFLRAAAHPLPAEHGIFGHRPLRVGQRLQNFVFDCDGLRRPAGRFRMVGGHQGHRLPPVFHFFGAQHRLVGVLQPEGFASGHVVVDQHGVHAGHGQGGGDVQPGDFRLGVGAAQGGPPQHPLHVQVGGIKVGPIHFGNAVRPYRGLPDAAFHPAGADPGGHRFSSASSSRPRRMAP